MAEPKRKAASVIAPRAGPAGRHTVGHTRALRRKDKVVPLLARPPGAPLSRATQAEGMGTRPARTTAGQGGNAQLDRRVLAEGLPAAAPGLAVAVLAAV